MANSLWYSGTRDPKSPLSAKDILAFMGRREDEHRRGRESREQHNEMREVKARRESPARRIERMRLFGHYSDKTGRTFTKSQVQRFLQELRRGLIPKIPLDKDSVQYHAPEAEKDQVDSVGEIYVPKGRNYPALRIPEGTVLIDPKIRHVDPALK